MVGYLPTDVEHPTGLSWLTEDRSADEGLAKLPVAPMGVDECALDTPMAERLLDEALPAFERVLIDAAMQQTGGRRQEAARLLGWGRNTLTRKLKELELK